MNNNLDLPFLMADTRARVYLVWAFITGAGFTATHYYQSDKINALWFLLAAAGLLYMLKVMPVKVRVMRNIFLSWLVPISVGLIVSVLAFKVPALFELVPYLGAFWLFVMAAGFGLNGLVDPPSQWYWLAAVINIAGGLACFYIDSFTAAQYLVAAILGAWSMLNLWIFRT